MVNGPLRAETATCLQNGLLPREKRSGVKYCKFMDRLGEVLLLMTAADNTSGVSDLGIFASPAPPQNDNAEPLGRREDQCWTFYSVTTACGSCLPLRCSP